MGKSFSKNVMGLALATALVSSAAQAQTAPAAPAAPATSQAQASSFRDKVSLKLGVDAFGPAITDLQTSQPNPDTGKRDATSPVSSENWVNATYQLGGGYSTSAVGAFAYTTGGKGADMLDPQLRLSNGSLFKAGNFNYGSQVRLYMGVTEASRDANMLGNIRWYNNFGYEIPGSRWSFDLTTFIRPYLYTDAAPNAKVARFYAGPEVGYRFSPKLKAWLLFEYQGQSNAGAGILNLVPANGVGFTDLEPGLTWDVTPALTFTPYLDIKTSNRVALDTTTINASVSFKAL